METSIIAVAGMENGPIILLPSKEGLLEGVRTMGVVHLLWMNSLMNSAVKCAVGEGLWLEVGCWFCAF